jgi:L-malate glycosyltransferase
MVMTPLARQDQQPIFESHNSLNTLINRALHNQSSIEGNIIKPGVLHLIGNFNQGGSETQALQLVRLLQETGRYDLHIACLESTGVLRQQLAEFFLRSVPEFPLNRFYDLNALHQGKRFRDLLRRLNIQILQTHDFYTNIFGITIAALAGVPVRIGARRDVGGIRTSAQLRVERWAYRMAHAVVANSNSVRTQLVSEGIKANKIVTIPNGVDISRFEAHEARAREKILDSLGLPRSEVFVTIVANMRFPVKDQATFLRAAKIVHERHPQVSFVLAGEGELSDHYIALSKELGLTGSTHFIGRCDRVPELLSISDVCVLSSRAEGMPNVVLEYMSAAKPVVATDVGGTKELVVPGETGFLVEAGDHTTLGNYLISLLEDPKLAVAMGKRGRMIAQQEFSPQAQLNSVETLYWNLLQKRGKAFLPQVAEQPGKLSSS